MDSNELLDFKRDNFMKTINREKGGYVPTMLSGSCSPIGWAGKRAIDVIHDPQAYGEAMTDVFKEMWADSVIQFGTLFTGKVAQSFDPVQYQFGPDGTTPEHVQLSLMQVEEYSLLIENPDKFVSEVLLPRKYPGLYSDRNWAKQALKDYNDDKVETFVFLASALDKMLETRYGIFNCTNMMDEMITHPFDTLFDSLRGFRGTLTDLRRQPENVKAAIEALWEVRQKPGMAREVKASFPYGVQFPHVAPYLSPKQFEELYWPYEKQMLLRLAEGGNKAVIFMEGKWDKVWHLFLDLPKDCCILLLDEDDIFKAHKELGAHQILCGGYNSIDARCKPFHIFKDDVKRVIDTCATEGGFLFAPNKAWIAPDDINQCTIDIYNFVHEYTTR